METKQIEVDCPCCDTRLTIDVRTRTVLKHVRAEQRDGDGFVKPDDERWGTAVDRAETRVDSAQDKLDRAMREEREKESRLDDLFDKANERLRDRDDD